MAKSEIIVIGEIRTVLQEAYMPRWEAKGLLVVDSVMYSEKTHVGDTLHFKWEESRNNGITRGVFHQKGIWMIKPKGKDGFHTGYFRPIADIAEIEFMLQKKK